MKNRLLVAYLNESSQTTRITPHDVGVLLCKMSEAQINEFMQAVRGESYTMTDGKKKMLNSKFCELNL